MSIYKEVCNLKNSFDALLEYVQGGGELDAEVWGMLAEFKPVMSKIRDIHIRRESTKGVPVSKLAEMWKLCPPRVERITKTRPQPDQKPQPNKLVVYMGNEITVPRGARWLAYNADRVVCAFSKEPEAKGNTWASDAIFAHVCGIANVPAEDWWHSLRKISHLEEIV